MGQRMNTALLFLFVAVTVLYSLLWHNKEARSLERNQPRKPDAKAVRLPRNTDLQKPSECAEMLGQIERQLP